MFEKLGIIIAKYAVRNYTESCSMCFILKDARYSGGDGDGDYL